MSVLRSLLQTRSQSLTAAAAVIAAASLASRLLGVLRDRVLASQFGAGAELDIYYAAFRLPDLLYTLVIVGALSAGFIPVFTEYLENQQRAWRLLSTTVNVAALFLGGGAVVCWLLAPQLVRVLVPGFDSDQQFATMVLTRILLFSPIFLGISGIFGGVLQSLRHFFIFSLSPIFYNVGIIIGALFFVPAIGLSGLAFGVVFGAALHCLIQIGAVVSFGYRHRWTLRDEAPGMKKVLKMMVPRTLALGMSQLSLVVLTTIGSSLAAGTVAIFSLANNLQSLPLGLFGVSIAVAAFPMLSASAKKPEEFVQILSHGIRQMLVLILPASALLIVLRAQVVRAVLGAGQFSWEDTRLTLTTLSILAVGLFAQSLVLLFARAWYALQDTKTPLIVALISETVCIGLALTLSFHFSFGVAGLAWAYTVGQITNSLGLWLALWWKLGDLDGRRIVQSVSRLLVATGLLALVAWATKFVIEPWSGTQTFLGIVLQAGAASVAGCLTYVGIGVLLGSEELQEVARSFRKKVLRRAPAPTELVDGA